MKRILISITLVTLMSCQLNTYKEPIAKYKEGDIVYLKPDSTKAIVIRVINGNWYDVRYKDSNGIIREIPSTGRESSLSEIDFY